MNTPSFRDIEQLSAFLDGQLSQAKKTRLEARLKSDPALTAALEELRQTRNLLRQTPRRRVPRNFILTPKMAGIRPPVPRAVPVLSWASAIAVLLFIVSLGSNWLGQFTLGAAGPMMAAAPAADHARPGYGGGLPVATSAPATIAPALAVPATQVPVSTQAFVNGNAEDTLTAEAPTMTIPESTPPGVSNVAKTSPTQKVGQSVKIWPLVWLGLAALLIATAFIIRWSRNRAFAKRMKGE